jgi:hypothetical protein
MRDDRGHAPKQKQIHAFKQLPTDGPTSGKQIYHTFPGQPEPGRSTTAYPGLGEQLNRATDTKTPYDVRPTRESPKNRYVNSVFLQEQSISTH